MPSPSSQRVYTVLACKVQHGRMASSSAGGSVDVVCAGEENVRMHLKAYFEGGGGVAM